MFSNEQKLKSERFCHAHSISCHIESSKSWHVGNGIARVLNKSSKQFNVYNKLIFGSYPKFFENFLVKETVKLMMYCWLFRLSFAELDVLFVYK